MSSYAESERSIASTTGTTCQSNPERITETRLVGTSDFVA